MLNLPPELQKLDDDKRCVAVMEVSDPFVVGERGGHRAVLAPGVVVEAREGGGQRGRTQPVARPEACLLAVADLQGGGSEEEGALVGGKLHVKTTPISGAVGAA